MQSAIETDFVSLKCKKNDSDVHQRNILAIFKNLRYDDRKKIKKQDIQGDHMSPANVLVVRFGKIRALQIAFALHGISVIFAALFGWTAQLGWIYYLGTAAFAGLILYEHSLVSPQDITRVNIAFFTVNGVISAGLFLCAATDLLLF